MKPITYGIPLGADQSFEITFTRKPTFKEMQSAIDLLFQINGVNWPEVVAQNLAKESLDKLAKDRATLDNQPPINHDQSSS